MPSSIRARRNLGRLLLALTFPWLIVEGLLQAGALVVWVTRRDESSPLLESSSSKTIVCLGDSFTYGQGAHDVDGAYPAVLGRLLSAPTPGWRVLNWGWPGRNSREALDLLHRRIATVRPKIVVILIGINDRWSHPELLAIDPGQQDGTGSDGFVLRLRTLRLLRLLLQPRSADNAKPQPKTAGSSRPIRPMHVPLVGIWSSPRVTLRLVRHGSAVLQNRSFQWTVDGNTLFLTDPGGKTSQMTYAIAGDRLRVDFPAPLGTVELARQGESAAPEEPMDDHEFARRARDLFLVNDDVAADALLDQWRACLPPSVAWHATAVELAVRLGSRADAEGSIDWLSKNAANSADVGERRHWVRSLMLMGRLEAAIDEARKALVVTPSDLELWRDLADAALLLENWGIAEEAALRAVGLSARLPPEVRWRDHALYASAIMQRDPGAALKSILRADQWSADDTLLPRFLVQFRKPAQAAWPRLRESGAFDAAEVAMVDALMTPREIDAGTQSILLAHLRALVEVCRAHQAVPVLLSYPFKDAGIDAVQAGIAASHGVEVVRAWERFNRLLRSLRREELFVPDGHCNDRGYRELAEEVAASLTGLGHLR